MSDPPSINSRYASAPLAFYFNRHARRSRISRARMSRFHCSPAISRPDVATRLQITRPARLEVHRQTSALNYSTLPIERKIFVRAPGATRRADARTESPGVLSRFAARGICNQTRTSKCTDAPRRRRISTETECSRSCACARARERITGAFDTEECSPATATFRSTVLCSNAETRIPPFDRRANAIPLSYGRARLAVK